MVRHPVPKRRPTPLHRVTADAQLLRQLPSAYLGESGHKRRPLALPPMRRCACRAISRRRVAVEVRGVRKGFHDVGILLPIGIVRQHATVCYGRHRILCCNKAGRRRAAFSNLTRGTMSNLGAAAGTVRHIPREISRAPYDLAKLFQPGELWNTDCEPPAISS